MVLSALVLMMGCKDRTQTPATSPERKSVAEPIALPSLPPQELVVLVHSTHDTLQSARLGLEAAMRLRVDLPLPFPRVEHSDDHFRVVLARGAFGTLKPLILAVLGELPTAKVIPPSQAGGDDVIRLAVVCTDQARVPLYTTPGVTTKKNLLVDTQHPIAHLTHGQVLVLKEDSEGEPGDEEEGSAPTLAEQGFLQVLQPQPGLVRGTDVLLPADCTPRDEDNDDGNGRILGLRKAAPGESAGKGSAQPEQTGQLCLTTRFSARKDSIAHADVLAVRPNYRSCQRFPEAGTFDGFDHSADGHHFAVEIIPSPESPTQGVGFHGLDVFAVGAHGEITQRGRLSRLSRPAFLGEQLVAVKEDQAGVEVVGIPGLLRRDPSDGAPLAEPKRLAYVALPSLPPIPASRPHHRPGAPTLSDGKIHVLFQRSCTNEHQKRVRALAGKNYVLCVTDLAVEIPLQGAAPTRICHLDNLDNPLDEPVTIPCPA